MCHLSPQINARDAGIYPLPDAKLYRMLVCNSSAADAQVTADKKKNKKKTDFH